MKGVVFEFSSKQIRGMFEEGIGMENRAFVVNVPAEFATTITISAAKRLTTLTG